MHRYLFFPIKEMQQALAKSGHVVADMSTRNQLENLQLRDEMDREQRALLVSADSHKKLNLINNVYFHNNSFFHEMFIVYVIVLLLYFLCLFSFFVRDMYLADVFISIKYIYM